MTTITILASLGVVFGALSLEAILLFVLETPKGKSIVKRIKHGFRHWWWKNFNWKDDFVEKD